MDSMEYPLLEGRIARYYRRTMGEAEVIVVNFHLHGVALFEFASKNLNRERVLNQSLNGAFERAGAVDRIVALCRRARLWPAR